MDDSLDDIRRMLRPVRLAGCPTHSWCVRMSGNTPLMEYRFSSTSFLYLNLFSFRIPTQAKRRLEWGTRLSSKIGASRCQSSYASMASQPMDRASTWCPGTVSVWKEIKLLLFLPQELASVTLVWCTQCLLKDQLANTNSRSEFYLHYAMVTNF